MAYGQLKSAIRTRHALGRLWREEPGSASTPLAPPIIVLGQMRSGTTRVQRLLAADPQFSGTRFCDSHNPVPSRPDLRPMKARAALFMARRVNPWLDTVHPFGATRTDEEIGWLAAALSPAAFEAQWRIPAYLAFSEARDAGPVYREFARILRTDAAFHDTAERPRVLKCPQFAEDLPALLAQFPDARIVHCRRDTDDVLASSISMVASQMAFQSDEHDLSALEREWRRKVALREERMTSALDTFTGPVAVVDFARLNADWRDAIAETYAVLGVKFTGDVESAMRKERAASRDDAHRHHKAQMLNFAN
nr:sulfotransferase [Qipengyuania polymorpha]